MKPLPTYADPTLGKRFDSTRQLRRAQRQAIRRAVHSLDVI